MATNLAHFNRGRRAGRVPDLPVPDAGAGHARRAHAGGGGYAWAGILFCTAGRIADVELVAFLIYQFLMLVRGTRAAPMLVGEATLGLAFYFARLGELRTLNWLLSTLLPYVVFALIVVFQSEIRHALANLGSRVSLMRSSASAADVYDDIVLAANFFSQNQTGALIVIEREIGLRSEEHTSEL